MKKALWISYDIGVRGDYERLKCAQLSRQLFNKNKGSSPYRVGKNERKKS